MNLESEILKEHSKRNAEKIPRWIGNDPKRFEQLMKLFLYGEYRVVQRSAWIVSLCTEQFPSLIAPWLSKMINRSQDAEVHDAVKRNVLRALQFIYIPKSLQGKVVNICFDFLHSSDTPIAVKVFSMTVLANIAKNEPDLKSEVILVIQEMLPYGGPAIVSRAKKVLKQLSR